GLPGTGTRRELELGAPATAEHHQSGTGDGPLGPGASRLGPPGALPQPRSAAAAKLGSGSRQTPWSPRCDRRAGPQTRWDPLRALAGWYDLPAAHLTAPPDGRRKTRMLDAFPEAEIARVPMSSEARESDCDLPTDPAYAPSRARMLECETASRMT